MRHVICKLPNASENISGVVFARQADGSVMTVEPMDDVAAQEMFGSIDGYSLVDPDAKPDNKAKRPSKDELAAKAAAEAGVQPPPPPAPDAPPAPAADATAPA